jgi:hypothetical protein
MGDDELLTPEQAGALAGPVSDTTIWRWIKAGDLVAVNIGTRRRPRYRVRLAALRACLAAREEHPVRRRRAA